MTMAQGGLSALPPWSRPMGFGFGGSVFPGILILADEHSLWGYLEFGNAEIDVMDFYAYLPR